CEYKPVSLQLSVAPQGAKTTITGDLTRLDFKGDPVPGSDGKTHFSVVIELPTLEIATLKRGPNEIHFAPKPSKSPTPVSSHSEAETDDAGQPNNDGSISVEYRDEQTRITRLGRATVKWGGYIDASSNNDPNWRAVLVGVMTNVRT